MSDATHVRSGDATAGDMSSATSGPKPVQPIAIRPSSGADRIGAFMDIGTNSVRLSLVRISPKHAYTILSQQKEVVRLGENAFADDCLQPEAMRRAVLVCRKFAEMARAYGADDILAVATAATREAKNQREFARLMAQEAGIEIHTISGIEEARLIYLGVASGIEIGEQRAAFIDIGGGSTELIVGDQRRHYALDSLKLGAIRLTSLFFMLGESGPVTPDRFALIQRYVRNVAIRSVQRFRAQRIDLAIGSSGTIENLADMAVRHAHRRLRQRDDEVTVGQLQAVVGMLCALPLEERRRVPGMNPARADIIVAGAAILLTLMEDLGLGAIRVSDRGLREGLIVDYLDRSHPEIMGDLTVRERSVRRLGRSCGFDEAHAETVARLALSLFDSASDIGLHDLGPHEREILRFAAMLHDIGVFLSYENHHAHTAYLIRNAELLGFDQTEVAIMALVARFHRKGLPSRKTNADYAALDKRSRRVVKQLSPIMRLAENLDRSHAGLVQGARFEPIDARTVALTIHANQDCQLELWGVQANRRLFEKVYGRGIRITDLKDYADFTEG